MQMTPSNLSRTFEVILPAKDISLIADALAHTDGAMLSAYIRQHHVRTIQKGEEKSSHLFLPGSDLLKITESLELHRNNFREEAPHYSRITGLLGYLEDVGAPGAIEPEPVVKAKAPPRELTDEEKYAKKRDQIFREMIGAPAKQSLWGQGETDPGWERSRQRVQEWVGQEHALEWVPNEGAEEFEIRAEDILSEKRSEGGTHHALKATHALKEAILAASGALKVFLERVRELWGEDLLEDEEVEDILDTLRSGAPIDREELLEKKRTECKAGKCVQIAMREMPQGSLNKVQNRATLLMGLPDETIKTLFLSAGSEEEVVKTLPAFRDRQQRAQERQQKYADRNFKLRG